MAELADAVDSLAKVRTSASLSDCKHTVLMPRMHSFSWPQQLRGIDASIRKHSKKADDVKHSLMQAQNTSDQLQHEADGLVHEIVKLDTMKLSPLLKQRQIAEERIRSTGEQVQTAQVKRFTLFLRWFSSQTE